MRSRDSAKAEKAGGHENLELEPARHRTTDALVDWAEETLPGDEGRLSQGPSVAATPIPEEPVQPPRKRYRLSLRTRIALLHDEIYGDRWNDTDASFSLQGLFYLALQLGLFAVLAEPDFDDKVRDDRRANWRAKTRYE